MDPPGALAYGPIGIVSLGTAAPLKKARVRFALDADGVGEADAEAGESGGLDLRPRAADGELRRRLDAGLDCRGRSLGHPDHHVGLRRVLIV